MVEFSDLVGKTLNQITVIKDDDKAEDTIYFSTNDGLRFRLYHCQDCCECVRIEEIIGDINDLLNYPILMAEEVSEDGDEGESSTWTFYKLSTIKGSITIRWLGTSNGYYSEAVSFAEDKYDKPNRWEMHRNGLYVPDPAVAGLVYDPSCCSWVKL